MRRSPRMRAASAGKNSVRTADCAGLFGRLTLTCVGMRIEHTDQEVYLEPPTFHEQRASDRARFAASRASSGAGSDSAKSRETAPRSQISALAASPVSETGARFP